MEDFVTFEIAKKLHEKGFNKNTMQSYNDQGELMVILPDVWEAVNTIPAPTKVEALDWLRKDKGYYVEIVYDDNPYGNWRVRIKVIGKPEGFIIGRLFDSFEESIIYGIEYALDNLI